jgi:hypothetical protein
MSAKETTGSQHADAHRRGPSSSSLGHQDCDRAAAGEPGNVGAIPAGQRQMTERASDLPTVVRHGLIDLTAAMEQAVRSAYLAGISHERQRCAKIADDYGREGDRLSKEFACETADEIAARIREPAYAR